MDRLASMLPEYELVMGMEGIGKVTGPQLMAEVGDVRRFSHKGALVERGRQDPDPPCEPPASARLRFPP